MDSLSATETWFALVAVVTVVPAITVANATPATVMASASKVPSKSPSTASTFPTKVVAVTFPVTDKPDEEKLPLVVPPQVISKVSAALEKIPVFKSSRNPSAGAEFVPSSSVKVPSSCNKVTHPSFELFLIFKTPSFVSAHH